MKKLLLMVLALCLMIPMTAFAASERVSIEGDHGKLSAIIQRPDGLSKYPMVMLLHGFTSSKEDPIMTHLADGLEKNGIASIRFDFNGHGQSEGRFQDMTVPNEIEDAKKVYDYVKKLPGVTSIAMAGHSQGGVVTSMTAGELGTDKIKAIVLLAPAAVLREDAIRGNLFGTSFKSLDPPEYVEIFGGHKVGKKYIETARDLPIFETAARYQGYACMIHGTGDQIVPYTYSERYAHIYPNSELHLLPGYDHAFSQGVEKATDIAVDYLIKQLKDEK